MCITKKRNWSIKARKVADGSKQHTHDGHNKYDGSSPIVVTGSIFLTGVIDAKKLRDMTIMDIASAFLHAENAEKILMLPQSRLTKMIVQVNPTMPCKYIVHLLNVPIYVILQAE